MTDIIKYARNSSISGEQRQISPIPGLTRHFWTDAESFPSREISPIQGVEPVQIKTEMVEEDEKEEDNGKKDEKEEKEGENGEKEEENGEKEETEDDEKGDLVIAETERYVYC